MISKFYFDFSNLLLPYVHIALIITYCFMQTRLASTLTSRILMDR